MELKYVLQGRKAFNFAQDFTVLEMYQKCKSKYYSPARICKPIKVFTTSQNVIPNIVKTPGYKLLVRILHLHTIGASGIDVKNT